MKHHSGAGVLLKDKNGKFLLQLRDRKKTISSPGKWSVFGGGVKRNETPLDAIVREMKEELELDMDKSHVKQVIVFPMPRRKQYLFIYKKSIDPSKLKLHEGRKMGLFSEKEIRRMKGVAYATKLFFIFGRF